MRMLLTAEYHGLTKINFLSAGFVFPHANISTLRLEALHAALPEIDSISVSGAKSALQCI